MTIEKEVIQWDNLEYPGLIKMHPQEKLTAPLWVIGSRAWGRFLQAHKITDQRIFRGMEYVEDIRQYGDIIHGVAYKEKDHCLPNPVNGYIMPNLLNGYDPFGGNP